MSRRPRRQRAAPSRDRGAALVIAIAFVVMIGTIVAGLTAAVTSGLQTRVTLERLRDRQYAADGTIELAIASARAEMQLGTLACGAASVIAGTGNGVDIHVDRLVVCGTALDSSGLPITQVTVVFTACEDQGTTCAEPDVVVRALVGFELDDSGSVVHVPVHSWSVTR